MAKLTDLPNELLLSIMADLSPLYIDTFVLICKRLYYLAIDTIRAQNLVRSRLPSCPLGSVPADLLRSILQDPDMSMYPLSFSVFLSDFFPCLVNDPQDLFGKIKLQIAQSPHPCLPKVIDSREKAAYSIVPLLITRLLNLRKLKISGFWQPYLLDTVSWIVEASHDEGRSTKEPLALGRLTEVSTNPRTQDINGLHLSILLSMIPTVRKLKISHMLHEAPYSFPYKFHGSAVTSMILDGCVDASFVKELIKSTRDLQSFEFTHLPQFFSRDIAFRRLSEILLQHAGASLLHLSLLTEDCKDCADGLCTRNPRKHADLSLGSLRGFHNLKTIVTSVEMLKRTHDSYFQWIGIGRIQRLVSCLPASLEALVLHKGSEKWDKDVLNELFRGLRSRRQLCLPNLKLVDFVSFPGFDQVMPGDVKAACRELGIKIGYTLHDRYALHRAQVLQQLEMLEELPWIAAMENCYQPKDIRVVNGCLYKISTICP